MTDSMIPLNCGAEHNILRGPTGPRLQMLFVLCKINSEKQTLRMTAVQLALGIRLTHGVLRFVTRIAFCCVRHRSSSRGIPC